MTDADRGARNLVVRALLERLDVHSPSERDHAERVAVFSVATGEAMGLSDEALLDLRYAAVLHDVGKVAVDSRLLRKAGRLSDEELDGIRFHALLAASVLEGIDWLASALPSIRHHHERWDGEGYPDRLSGPDIPIGARIIHVAEVFDVLTGAVPFRSEMPEEAALDEIKRCAGTQFDPRVVEAFLRVQPLIQPIRT